MRDDGYDFERPTPRCVTFTDLALALIALAGVFFWVVLLLSIGGYYQ